MPELLKDFKSEFLDRMLTILWRQWSVLGVLGGTTEKEPRILDPEAMLLITLEFARYDPRLFDEMLDWLAANGKLLDVQRLRGIVGKKSSLSNPLLGGIAAFLVHIGDERKWKNLSEVCRRQYSDHMDPIPLFLQKDGTPFPLIEDADPSFSSSGFNRPTVHIRKISRPVPIGPHCTLRFLLRALFGIGSRAECLVYLLSHPGGHPSEVAQAVGLSVRGTQDALIELARSGLVQTRKKGRRKIEYWLSQEQWWQFLSQGAKTTVELPQWIDWVALYAALATVWKSLCEIDNAEMSDYLKASKLRDALEASSNEFAQSGLNLPAAPLQGGAPDQFVLAFITFLSAVLDGI